jgi:hypothetical protein
MPVVSVCFFRRFAAVLVIVGMLSPAIGQVKYPPGPQSYHVDLRYDIRAGQDERIRQYRAMTEHLDRLGFVADPREDADLDAFDPTAVRMSGMIPATNAARILEDPRIRTILLTPSGMTLPDDPAAPVQIRITLPGGLERGEQLQLHAQAVAQLARLGFQENVGYDHRGYTLIRGAIPASKVPLLLRDLRDLPGGWFAADTPRDELPLPLRNVLPVRIVEVLPDVEGLQPPLPITPAVGKLTPDLRNVLADPASQDRPLRVEAILTGTVGEFTAAFQLHLRRVLPGAALEGVVGDVVAVRLATGADLAKFAEFEEVAVIRLPQTAVTTVRPAPANVTAPTTEQVLASTRVNELHARGYRGAGVRVAIIGTDFPGLNDLIGKQLPQTTRFIDMTAALTPTVEPIPSAPDAPVTGIETALAVHAAAPDAELTLIRIDPSALYQLMTVARHVAGERGASIAMQSLGIELQAEAEDLARIREDVLAEYTQAFADLRDDEGPARRREAAQQAVARLLANERALATKVARFLALRDELDRLAGITVIVNTLVWESGFPHDGLSAISQVIDERFISRPTRTALTAERLQPPPVWVQAGSDSVGSVWAGPFLDADGNGVMEFALAGTKPPEGLWTTELNFLGAMGADGQVSDLTEGTRLRFTIQWREPLPLDPAQPAPVFVPHLRLLRQLDPTGTQTASDEMTEVARSEGIPIRIQLNPASAIYEQMLEVTLPATGRYALRIEGSTTARGSLPGLNRTIEVQPRLFVRSLGAGGGQPVFTTFAPRSAGVGVPGDSSAALTIGFASGTNGTTPGGLTGTGPGVNLRVKPDLLAPGIMVVNGEGRLGSGVAAGYAGGVSASLVGAGVRPTNLIRTFGIQPGKPLVLPTEWIQTLVPRPLPR